jgi:hypothetical protein
VRGYEAIPGFENLYLEDSWVLGVYESDTALSFDVEAVLTEQHPQRKPRRRDEQHSYRRVSLTFPNLSRIEWLDRGLRPAVDATGELDRGHIDTLIYTDGTYELAGDWGHVRFASDPPVVRDR